MNLLVVFALNLAVTILVEGVVLFLIQRDCKLVYFSLLANLLTNPALNLLLTLAVTCLGKGVYYFFLIALECAAVGVEAVIYRRLGGLSKLRSLWLSLLLNALSFLVGLALNLLLW